MEIQVLTLLVAVSITASCGLVTSEVKASLSSTESEMRCTLCGDRNNRDNLARVQIDHRKPSRVPRSPSKHGGRRG